MAPTISPDLYKISTWGQAIRDRSHTDHFPSKRSDRIVGTQIVYVGFGKTKGEARVYGGFTLVIID